MQIPIENIYYLLCYAWNKLEEQGRVDVNARDLSSLPDLFAKVLINGTRILLKRGVDKNYQVITEQVAGIKGKMEYSATIKLNLLSRKKALCSFDTFSINILSNRILFTTIRQLMQIKGLDQQLKTDLWKISLMLEGIAPIIIEKKMFRQIRLNRNNRFYEFILHVCEIIYDNLLVTEEPGKYKFADFTQDERKMNQLFEHFIRNFYRIEQQIYQHVGSEQINWKFDSQNAESMEYLPIMKTDISLSNDHHKIIIDAKYYSETMVNHYEKEKIRSAHLYQLFSYIMHQETEDARTRTASGMILYPTVDKEYDLFYRFHEHRIQIRTVNLNQDWRHIAARLLSMV